MGLKETIAKKILDMIGKVLGFIFKRKLLNELLNDNELQNMLKDGDNYLDKTKKELDKLEENGYIIPDYLKKMVSKK